MRRRFIKRPRRLSRGLGARLFISHFLVALVGALTTLTVTFILAPVVFGRLAGWPEGAAAFGRFFGPSLLYSLLLAGLAATAAAAVASLLVSRRVVGSLRYVVDATRRIASGRYGERVPVRDDDELGELSASFNAMARALDEAERRRMEVIYDLSHELRTPLSTLRGYTEGLAEGVIEPSEETWALLRVEADRMGRLVDDLRRLSQAEAGQLALDLAPISPAETIRLAAEKMRPAFEEEDVALVGFASGELPPVMADADRVVQVLMNLVSNALRHTPRTGRVTVSASLAGGEVVFEVEDTGDGLAPEHLLHVFERFYRVDKSRSRAEAGGGSGVGLAISKALVEVMNGRIWVESPGVGQGARFSFTIPVVRAGSRPQS
jgi:two-component system sensor histidine kinase BaeS